MDWTELLKDILVVASPVVAVYIAGLLPGPLRGIARRIIENIIEKTTKEHLFNEEIRKDSKRKVAEDAVLKAENLIKPGLASEDSKDLKQELNSTAKQVAMDDAIKAGLFETSQEASDAIERALARLKYKGEVPTPAVAE